jgi:hypothetical protein
MQTNKAILAEIAKKHLAIDTLDSQQSDQLDFHDLAVWSIEQALEAAFQAGLAAAALQQPTTEETTHESL